MAHPVLERLVGGLVASCQPVPGGPTDGVPFVVAFALATRDGGARGLRIEGVENVRAVAKACDLPVIGLVKRDVPTTDVRITPFVDDAVALASAGAAIVAFDATERPRPASVASLVAAIHAKGALAMADIATLAEARAALEAGVDIIGTTLSGYVGAGPVPAKPDLDLVRACRSLGVPVFAEGRYNEPRLAAAAIRAGAAAVVVGSAITRPEHVTRWFADAVGAARPRPVLALDIGGSKIAAAVVEGARVVARLQDRTDAGTGPDAWLETARAMSAGWGGGWHCVSAAVAGLVDEGRWSAVSEGILPIPPGYSLLERLAETFGCPATALNDAQAAAWGEHVHGAGAGRDSVFLTVSSGVGGGIVIGGRLLQGRNGLAGHVGQMPLRDGRTLEDACSGFAIARAASAAGHAMDARAVFEAAGRGESWAKQIVDDVATAFVDGLTRLQFLLAPEVFVLGGGVGLSRGFLDRVDATLQGMTGPSRPSVIRAALGADAGLVGCADFAALGEAER
ncbi:putative N-acetylmannosamine-6-phosphate 2-epimerase [Alsobacter sp. R-9]